MQTWLNVFVCRVEMEGEPPGWVKEDLQVEKMLSTHLLNSASPWNGLWTYGSGKGPGSTGSLDPFSLLTQALGFPFVTRSSSAGTP